MQIKIETAAAKWNVQYKIIAMSLATYKTKRNFKSSPEPKGGKSGEDKLRFVVQKHDASHLHYDFRLEMGGVLKSWAVPKGPSADPEIKRLAMMVEDHPYDYRNFEGIIPSGYGAGTVMIWDEGFYEPADETAAGKKEQDKNLRHQFYTGKLKINLHGTKLKGAFALIKANGRGENAWLLFKLKDKYASVNDITLKDKSVRSKKTLAQLKKSAGKFNGTEKVKSTTVKNKKEIVSPRSNVKTASKTKPQKDKKTALKTAPASKDVKAVESILKKTTKQKIPATLEPMLATLVDKPFAEDGWLYEIKWDGYRAVAFINKGSVEIKSRNSKSFADKFYPVTQALKNWDINVVVDGEIVVVNEKGIADFGALQNWRSEADGELYYYLFDIIWLNGKDLSALPLTDRKVILKSVVPAGDIIKLSESFEESGITFFETIKKLGIEGMIAKKASSAYTAGARSKEWLKIKANKKQEVVIGGYTKNDDSSKLFSSLLVGVYKNNELVYTGKIGTGFNNKTEQDMMKQFKPLVIKKAPFAQLPDVNKPSRFRPDPPHATATWLKPALVCEVSFTEMTTDGVMRHPSFEGMRIDKKAKDVIMEKPKHTDDIVHAATHKSNGKMIAAPVKKSDRKTFLNPNEETQVRKINGHELKFTNLSKLYWPKEKISKRDMLNYYYQVAPYILPYLKNRPQSMNRHPNGIEGESFYFKDVTGKAPDWIETFKYKSDADNRTRQYLVAKDEASLLYMASLGCIEMNPWSSTVKKEDYPDWCIIDLDPDKNTFDKVIEAALVTKDVLDAMGVPSYPKTSGSTGMHIYIPLGAKYTYEQSKEFARVIAKLVQEQIPGFTTIERTVKNRKGKIYIDFLQNRPQATVAAPYSIRPKPGATVSMPLEWAAVKKGLKMSDFTIFNVLQILKSTGDIFKPVLGKGIDLNSIIKKLEQQ